MSIPPMFGNNVCHRFVHGPTINWDKKMVHKMKENAHRPINTTRLFSKMSSGFVKDYMCNAVRETKPGVWFDKGVFTINLDVQHFKPEEIAIKISGDLGLVVECKHGEKPDQHGFISRCFVRRYVLPNNCAITRTESRLSPDGILTIAIPTYGEIQVKTIPIIQTGMPAIHQQTLQQKK